MGEKYQSWKKTLKMKMKMTGRNGKDALRYAKIRLGGGDKELI